MFQCKLMQKTCHRIPCWSGCMPLSPRYNHILWHFQIQWHFPKFTKFTADNSSSFAEYIPHLDSHTVPLSFRVVNRSLWALLRLIAQGRGIIAIISIIPKYYCDYIEIPPIMTFNFAIMGFDYSIMPPRKKQLIDNRYFLRIPFPPRN